VFFVLTQLVFMLPTTPGGVGVYEAGVIGVFRLLGWDPALGAAYGVLLRLDDVLFIGASMAAVGAGTFGASAQVEPEELEGSGAATGGRAP